MRLRRLAEPKVGRERVPDDSSRAAKRSHEAPPAPAPHQHPGTARGTELPGVCRGFPRRGPPQLLACSRGAALQPPGCPPGRRAAGGWEAGAGCSRGSLLALRREVRCDTRQGAEAAAGLQPGHGSWSSRFCREQRGQPEQAEPEPAAAEPAPQTRRHSAAGRARSDLGSRWRFPWGTGWWRWSLSLHAAVLGCSYAGAVCPCTRRDAPDLCLILPVRGLL